MKRLFALILVLAMAAMFPISASAAGPDARSSVYYEWVDDWDDDYWDEDDASGYYDDYYDDWLMEVRWALEEKMAKEYKGKLELPYWCWYDIDGDGLSELIVDNNDGKYGVESFTCKIYNNMGTKPIITKGDFTVYYWDYDADKAASLKVNSNNMFLSIHPNGYLVASTLNGNTETYNIYGFHHIGTKMVAKTFTLTYKGSEFQTIKIKNPDGKYEKIDEDWFSCLELFDILNKSTPLNFYQTS